MIKKRYLLVLSVAIISVLLGSLLYNNLVLAGKHVPETQPVEVTNFPQDEQGNLKVISMPRTRTVTVCENKTISMSGEPILLGSVDFDGYTVIQVFVRSEAVENEPIASSYLIRFYFRAGNISAMTSSYINIHDPPYTTYYQNVLRAPMIEFYAEEGFGWASITVIAYLVSE